MYSATVRNHPISRLCLFVTLVTFTVLTVSGGSVFAQVPDGEQPAAKPEITSEQFELLEQAKTLLYTGEFDAAIDQLESIIQQFVDNDNLIRQAYHYLVSISLREKEDTGGAERYARQGLQRFPDLEAQSTDHHPSVNELYDELRSEMFGSLNISQPEDADIHLTIRDGEESHYGKSPMTIMYLPVGNYTLRLAKSGHEDLMEEIAISPGQVLAGSYSMEKTKGTMWWVYRIGAGVVAVGVLAVALVSGNSSEDPVPPPDPLPDPPDPPASSTD